jgi:FkbM family methyltransferase
VPGVDDVLVSIGRVIGKPRGWERVVRAVAPPHRFTSGALRPQKMPEGYLFPVDRGTLLGWHVHFFGSYEPEVREAINAWLEPGQSAIDVGANVGWHTLLMANRVRAAGCVYAFEPNDTTRARLSEALRLNGLRQVIVESRGVADQPGLHPFQAPAAGDFWDGTGRLTDDRGAATAEIACVTLDDFIAERGLESLALLKIDVEGWELSVLRGGRRVLDTLRPAVVFEYDPAYVGRCGGSGEALTALLADRSYILFELLPGRQPLSTPRLAHRGGNFLAIPRERAVR